MRWRISSSSAVCTGVSLSESSEDVACEQQQRRVAQDGSCDRNSLALTSRQRDAALAEFGFKCVRQSLDEFGGAGENRCTFDLGVVS